MGGVALGVEQRRRGIEGGKRRRIAGLDREQRARARGSRRVEFRLGLVARADADRLLAPAAPGEVGQRGKRLLRAAAMVDQLAKRHGADLLAADQPEARQALFVRPEVPAAAERASGACVAQDRLANLALLAIEQPANVRVVLEEDERGIMATTVNPAQPVTR